MNKKLYNLIVVIVGGVSTAAIEICAQFVKDK